MCVQDRAKLALKLKKYKEQQMHQADEHLIQVLGMLDTVEWETQQLQVFEGLKAGNSILNAIHKVEDDSFGCMREAFGVWQLLTNAMARTWRRK